ncbi:MAG: hypothetical protein AMS25_18750 [Gemmatimonas sp. SM23_52]|nr:MAG: hypothetical protein AMS25_18750 [Gemmatimonas sp. SM23_52]
MNKIGTAVTALLLTIAVTDSALTQQVSLGVRGGFNGTKVTYEGGIEELNTNWESNFHVGGLARLDLHDLFAVQLEALYTRKGSGSVWRMDPAEGKVTLTYLEIPVLAVLKVPTGSGARLTPHLFAGPTVAFELDCHLNGSWFGSPIDADCDDPDVDVQRKTTDIGLLFGGGLAIAAGPGAILLDAMYDLGLRNLNDSSDDPNLTVKNNTFMVSAGYSIVVGGW